MAVDLNTRYCGLDFKNPVIVAAGALVCLGHGQDAGIGLAAGRLEFGQLIRPGGVLLQVVVDFIKLFDVVNFRFG